MKTKILSVVAVTMFIMTMFSGCLIDGVERHYLYLRVSPYKTGDKCGLYILNDRGIVVKTNEQVTIPEDGEAVFRDYDVKFDGMGNTYFLYFPYVKNLESMPAIGDTVETRNPLEFFGGLKDSMGVIRVARGLPGVCGEFIEVFQMTPLN